MQPGLCKVKKPWDVPEQKSNAFSIIWLTTFLDTVSCHQSYQSSGTGWGTHHFIVLCCSFILFLYALKKRTWRASPWLLKVSLEYWQTMEQNTVVILVGGSLLMICLSCRSKVWYFCGSIAQGFLVPPSFIWSKEGVKSEYLGIISELKLLYWMTYQGGKCRKLWLALCMGAAPCHHLKDLISQRAWISAVLPAVIS